MSLDDATKAELVALLQQVVRETVESHPLSDDEIQWVRLAIQAEAKRAEFRKAVIEKTFVALVGSGVVAVGGWIVNYVATHWKP